MTLFHSPTVRAYLLALIVLFCVLSARVEAKIPPTVEVQIDTFGIIDYCPFSGTFKQLRRYANRLYYEGKTVLANACYLKATHLSLDPYFQTNANLGGPPPQLPKFRESDFFTETRDVDPRHFDSIHDTAILMSRRTQERLMASALDFGSLPPYINEETVKRMIREEFRKRGASHRNSGVIPGSDRSEL